jgi:hypothetical protein
MHGTLSDYLIELVQNSVEADARKIEITITTDRHMVMRVADDGSGMDQQTVQRATDPFFSSGQKHRRRQGLGLALLKQTAEAANGSLTIDSVLGRGTIVTVTFDMTNIDCPPPGNLARTLVECLHCADGREVVINRMTEKKTYYCKRSELAEALGGLQTAQQLKLAERYITGQEELLEGGKP